MSSLLAFAAAALVVVATWGQGLAFSTVFFSAVLAGAAGGLAGAAIEKSNLAKGAMNGAVIGASVACAALCSGAGAGAGAGAGGGGGGGATIGGASSNSLVAKGTITAAGESLIEGQVVVYEITVESSSSVIPNLIGATIVAAAVGRAAAQNEVFNKPANKDRLQQIYQQEVGVMIYEGGGLQYDPVPEWLIGSAFIAGGLLKSIGQNAANAVKGFKPGKWLSHFEKHGAEFGYRSSVEYLRGAQNLANDVSENILRKYDIKTGITRVYNAIKNEFTAYNKNGNILTYFKPDNALKYWAKQPPVG